MEENELNHDVRLSEPDLEKQRVCVCVCVCTHVQVVDHESRQVIMRGNREGAEVWEQWDTCYKKAEDVTV